MTLPNSSLLVELKNLSFGYGDRVILNDLSFGIPRGKVTALMGVSGGGKTTVLRLIGGQYKAQSGSLQFDAQEVSALDRAGMYRARRRMGMLFQFGALFTDMSVFDNVAFPLREHTTLPSSMVRDIVLMKLQAVGLRGARDLFPSEISRLFHTEQGIQWIAIMDQNGVVTPRLLRLYSPWLMKQG
jgi:phospholipid/cholesterol/gamma-HCH transport system ATP-binding protein